MAGKTKEYLKKLQEKRERRAQGIYDIEDLRAEAERTKKFNEKWDRQVAKAIEDERKRFDDLREKRRAARARQPRSPISSYEGSDKQWIEDVDRLESDDFYTGDAKKKKIRNPHLRGLTGWDRLADNIESSRDRIKESIRSGNPVKRADGLGAASRKTLFDKVNSSTSKKLLMKRAKASARRLPMIGPIITGGMLLEAIFNNDAEAAQSEASQLISDPAGFLAPSELGNRAPTEREQLEYYMSNKEQ